MDAKTCVKECMLNIKSWMDQTHLQMNPSKTEFIYFGHPKQLQKCTETSINIVHDLVVRIDIICYPGLWMDANLNYKSHGTVKCQCAMMNFSKIRSIRHLLTLEITTHLVLSLCMLHLDYCNSVLYGLPNCTISKMQSPKHVHLLSTKMGQV